MATFSVWGRQGSPIVNVFARHVEGPGSVPPWVVMCAAHGGFGDTVGIL